MTTIAIAMTCYVIAVIAVIAMTTIAITTPVIALY